MGSFGAEATCSSNIVQAREEKHLHADKITDRLDSSACHNPHARHLPALELSLTVKALGCTHPFTVTLDCLLYLLL